jgi:hypothetical protein
MLSVIGALVILLQQPVPRPFPKPDEVPPAPPPAEKPVPPPTSGQAPADRAIPPPARKPATPAPVAAPTQEELGLPIYPGAQFLTSYDAGRGQRYYLFGTNATFAEIVAYYKTYLRREASASTTSRRSTCGKSDDSARKRWRSRRGSR